jgi:hypothetical protein
VARLTYFGTLDAFKRRFLDNRNTRSPTGGAFLETFRRVSGDTDIFKSSYFHLGAPQNQPEKRNSKSFFSKIRLVF